MKDIEDLLQKTSRTFALTIPLLPQPTRDEVGIAYLLFRIIDTFEDAPLWTPRRRVEALKRFVDVLQSEPGASNALVEECAATPPVSHAGYLELLAKMPAVLKRFAALQAPARASIRRHVASSAEGMARFVLRVDADGRLTLDTIEELRDYCYTVAGIVGAMLTELYLLGRLQLVRVARELQSRAVPFGEGLQLVNILKDAREDAREGRGYLPRQATLPEVFDLAARDLDMAADYVELLRHAGADPGIVAFNSSISKLATANLRLLRAQGLGAKLSRLDVARIQAEVLQEIRRPAFDPAVAASHLS
jgi:farnesyl-diphosphate farnesyltransferase